jgi:dimethylsulfoniopropionate demethylase
MVSPAFSLSKRVRPTPFTPRVDAAGCKAYTCYNHMRLPTVFRTFEEDYWHLLEHVQLWDVSAERQVEFRGPDAAKLIQMMTPRDLSKAKFGQCFYAPLVDETGGMINDPIILKLADDHFWASVADSDVVLWGKGLAAGLGLNVTVEEPDVSPFAIQGPKAEDLVAKVLGEEIRAIRFFRFAEIEFQGQKMFMARSGWSKQGGFEIYLNDSSLGLDLWDTFCEAGKEFNVGPGCPNLIERIEGGLFSYGNDMTYEHNPYEVSLDKYAKLDTGIDFLGRKALEEIVKQGVSRKMRGIKIEGNDCPPCMEDWIITGPNEQPAGSISSAAYSPRLKCGLGFAMVDRDFWETGTQVTVRTPEGNRLGTVTDLPFI